MVDRKQEASETICAVATPPGTGGVGIVRVSGPAVPDICRAVTGRLPEPRHALLTGFHDDDGSVIDSGLALYFSAPGSFTGEHVLELQGHGGQYIMNRVMQRILDLGARQARPGEFSERAFLNDKIDLVQAEAIADLVQSGTDAAARAAQRSLQGEFSRRIHGLQETLTALRVFVEAAIDFPDEEIDFLAESDIVERCRNASLEIREVLAAARQGRLLRDGIVLAIIGRPNAGKSSLLNALSGTDRAIVTEIPGTTRDVLRESIDLDGIPVHVADTAGIRETKDRIEAEGVRRARAALETADIVLLVEDASGTHESEVALMGEVPSHATGIRVANKIDLLDVGARRLLEDEGLVTVSALTGDGMDSLRERIRAAAGVVEDSGGSFSARQRHVEALKRAARHIDTGYHVMEETGSGELLAEELRLAQAALGELTGETLADDLLGDIFSSFCIGK